ncbi:MAG: 2OG-Fe(II) oxygenase [Usitatibacter sp.]
MGIATIANALSRSECRRAIEAAQEESFERGQMAGGTVGTRECYCAWIPDREHRTWLYDRVASIFEDANRQFQFSMTGIVEPLMAVSYGLGDYFEWHLDTGPGLAANRKLSLSLLLTEPQGYQGGNLEISAGAPMDLRLAAGTAIVFPSFLAHRVTPVTAGRRIALVAFAHGPTFC